MPNWRSSGEHDGGRRGRHALLLSPILPSTAPAGTRPAPGPYSPPLPVGLRPIVLSGSSWVGNRNDHPLRMLRAARSRRKRRRAERLCRRALTFTSPGGCGTRPRSPGRRATGRVVPALPSGGRSRSAPRMQVMLASMHQRGTHSELEQGRRHRQEAEALQHRHGACCSIEAAAAADAVYRAGIHG
jgi:hypothetical protein